ncbi:MAG: plastocyanin/azurin family copper-binding protein [Actinomycetota bacterium]|nr:plastocyanin/azurin family copper-binding protein [Actinomycetota bacterium]
MRRIGIVLGMSALLAACGGGSGGMDMGDGAQSGASTSAPAGTIRVNVAMRDIAFVPDKVEMKKGSTATFIFKNEGKVAHDAFIGQEKAQADHEKEMGGGGGAPQGMQSGNAVTLEPGKTGELTYTFNDAGVTTIGCHQPGHYEAGMRMAVTVT